VKVQINVDLHEVVKWKSVEAAIVLIDALRSIKPATIKKKVTGTLPRRKQQ
jgi:hypothetical protein